MCWNPRTFSACALSWLLPEVPVADVEDAPEAEPIVSLVAVPLSRVIVPCAFPLLLGTIVPRTSTLWPTWSFRSMSAFAINVTDPMSVPDIPADMPVDVPLPLVALALVETFEPGELPCCSADDDADPAICAFSSWNEFGLSPWRRQPVSVTLGAFELIVCGFEALL